MKVRKCHARFAATVALVALYLLNTPKAKADNIVDISVNASFALGSASQVVDPTPNFDLTGNFVLDDTTTPNANPNCDTCTQSATITSFDMILTPVGGSSYEFSSQTGSAQALCLNCFTPGFEFWGFSFSDSNAVLNLPTINFAPSQFWTLGQTYYLGSGFTSYPDGHAVGPWGFNSGDASFGGITGWTFGVSVGDVLTSGYVKVDGVQAVPEPTAFTMLLVGFAYFLVRRFKAVRRPVPEPSGMLSTA